MAARKSPFESRPAEGFEFREIGYSKSNQTATVRFRRPEAYNAYSTRSLQELAAALRDASFDDSVGVIVLTGEGTRAFCTGGDVKEYENLYTRRPRDYWKYMGLFRAYIEAILDSGKPTIARVNGMAVGGGNESHLACDLSVIAQHAFLKQVGTHVGSVACGGATQWLPIFVGDRRAREILMLNEPISAEKALEWGLVNRVVPSVMKSGKFLERASAEEIAKAQKNQDGYSIDLSLLDEAVNALAQKLLDCFPECVRYTKEQTNFWKNLAWHSTVGHARDWLALHFASWEPLEGMKAFVEKRAPRYAKLRELAASGKSSEWPWGPFARKCDACGASEMPEGFQFCGACGKPIPKET